MSGFALGSNPRTATAVGVAWGLLLVAAPLELDVWTIAVGGLRLTTAELTAALTLAITSLAAAAALAASPQAQARARALATSPLTWALLGWAAWHLLSAAWAGEGAAGSLKFALRVCGGVALAVAAWFVAADERVRGGALAGAIWALAVVATLAAIERLAGQRAEPLLRWWRPEPTWMLGEQRLSTVFDHANTLAGWLGLWLPLAAVRAATARGWRRWAAGAGLLAAIAMMGLTYSRAGLFVGVCGLWAVGRLAAPASGLRRLGPAAALALTLSFAANPDMLGRLGLRDRGYDVTYRVDAPCAGAPGSRQRVPVWVENHGAWPLSNAQAPGDLGWAPRQPDGTPDHAALRFAPLPPVDAGEGVTITIEVQLPDTPQWLDVAVDIRRRQVVWLGAVGVPLGHVVCRVAGPGDTLGPYAAGEGGAGFEQRRPEIGRAAYWRAAWALWTQRPWGGWGADQFRSLHREHVPEGTWDERARAHSIVVETAANLGLIGLALLAAWALLALGALVRWLGGWAALATRLRAGQGAGLSPPALGLWCGLGAFALHLQVDYFLGYTEMLLTFWPMLGLALAAAEASPAPSDAPDQEEEPCLTANR